MLARVATAHGPMHGGRVASSRLPACPAKRRPFRATMQLQSYPRGMTDRIPPSVAGHLFITVFPDGLQDDIPLRFHSIAPKLLIEASPG